VYSWGMGFNGHLGRDDLQTAVQPELVPINLREEERKLKLIKKKHSTMEEVEELLALQSFASSVRKRSLDNPLEVLEEDDFLVSATSFKK